MHDIKWIREQPDAFDGALARRGLPPAAKNLLELDNRRRTAIQRMELALARRNAISREIGAAKRSNEEEAAQKLLAEIAGLKAKIPELEVEEKKLSKELQDALAIIPNAPLADVPDGRDANDNVERHHFGAKRTQGFAPREHFDLGEALGQMDFQTAAKLSGARFVVLNGGLARMERALGQFMLDLHTGEHGYMEVAPPLLVRDEVFYGTAQLPKFEDDQFFALPGQSMHELVSAPDRQERAKEGPSLLDRRLGLIPTAEVPLTNLVRESILDEEVLPRRLAACTPCFRAEAGAAGKDTRGMIRQHQFTKVELVSITTAEHSKDEHERMLSCAEEVLRRLDLHYRVMTLCTGDMGFAAEKTYDIEVWLPGQGAYREISSCSSCGEFQARRMNARVRRKASRALQHVNTLNGSGVAVGRALIAVMETYQQEGGAIAVPEALRPYMGNLDVIRPAE